MTNAQLDTLELELRKLEGVRAAGFASQNDILFIQLFIEAYASTAALPFEATRIAQRHSSSPVAVELVRWSGSSSDENDQSSLQQFEGITDDIRNEETVGGTVGETRDQAQLGSTLPADLIEEVSVNETTKTPEELEEVSYPEIFSEEQDDQATAEEQLSTTNENQESSISEIDLSAAEEQEQEDERRAPNQAEERIVLLTVTTSADNDEIEVHLAYNEARTIGRAPTNRGLLGAIDATVEAVAELTGESDFHAEWARSLEPGPEHASLVAVGLTSDEGTDTRHGIAGGSSPIDAAARATLNALNRVPDLSTT